MDVKKMIACIAAFAVMCGSVFSCSQKFGTNSSSESEVSETTSEITDVSAETELTQTTEAAATEETTTTAKPVFKNAVSAKSGQAYLAVNDSNWWIQYWGESKDPLSYDAGVVDIDGDGDYTVSVTADTDGFRYETTKDIADQLVPEGIGFASVVIKDGANVFPYAIITINSIKIDGKKIKLNKKNYTTTEEDDLRANIFNTLVTDDKLPPDARCEDGYLFDDQDVTTPALINDGSYSARIADEADFKKWLTIEVDFTVTGTESYYDYGYYDYGYYY